MFEVIFLYSLALLWIIFATIQDIRTREIANWLNFSLILFALGFRFFYSLFLDAGFGLFYQGLIGLGIFFVLGNILYHGKMFAGGDAKTLIALGAVLPVSTNFFLNLQEFFMFLFIFLLIGAFYSILMSARLCMQNYWAFKKDFIKRFKKNKLLMMTSTSIVIILIFLILLTYPHNPYLIILTVLLLILPYVYLYAKSVDETTMIKKIDTKYLREGDWLYKDLKVKNNKMVRAHWDGLNKTEIALLKRNYRYVAIRRGIPFMPVFLISFLIFFYYSLFSSGYSFW